MTYEERQRYRELRDRVEALEERLSRGEAEAPMTREEGRELLRLLEAAVERMSPERWDRAMEAIATEAARRAGAMAAPQEMQREV